MRFKEGDLVVTKEIEPRSHASAIIVTKIGRVVHVYQDEDVFLAKCIGAFCHVYGYPLLGRRLPPSSDFEGWFHSECQLLFY